MRGNYQSCYLELGFGTLLLYNGNDAINSTTCIPVCWVHTVTASISRFLKCSCYYYEQTGISCRHIWHVMENVHPCDIDPWIKDVCVTWLTSLQNVCLWYTRQWQSMYQIDFAKYFKAKYSWSVVTNCNTCICCMQWSFTIFANSISRENIFELFQRWYCLSND